MPRFPFLLLPMILVPGPTADEVRPRAPNRPEVPVATTRVGSAVRDRFALAASAVDCRFADNLYGYNLLLARASAGQRAAIRAAAGEGRRQGAALTAANVATPCSTILDKLDAADNALLILAGHADEGEPSTGR